MTYDITSHTHLQVLTNVAFAGYRLPFLHPNVAIMIGPHVEEGLATQDLFLQKSPLPHEIIIKLEDVLLFGDI